MVKGNDLVSIVIPTRNSAEFLDNCLKSIKNQSYKSIEIVVVDNNSTDATKEIAHRYTNLVFNKGPERSPQKNLGAEKSNGKYLFFIDSDMEITKNVVKECVERMKKGDVGGIVIPEESFGKGFWAKCKKLERSFYIGIDWIEAARFFKKKVFKKFHGYDEKLVSAEDWDLHRRISIHYKIGRTTSMVRHNEGQLTFVNILTKKFYYGSKIKKYSSKNVNKRSFVKQSSIINRYILYLSHPRRLFSEPLVGIGMLFMKTCEFSIAAVAYFYNTSRLHI